MFQQSSRNKIVTHVGNEEGLVNAIRRVLTPFFTQKNYDNFAFETLHSELTDVKRLQTHSRDGKTVYYDTGPGNARQMLPY